MSTRESLRHLLRAHLPQPTEPWWVSWRRRYWIMQALGHRRVDFTDAPSGRCACGQVWSAATEQCSVVVCPAGWRKSVKFVELACPRNEE